MSKSTSYIIVIIILDFERSDKRIGFTVFKSVFFTVCEHIFYRTYHSIAPIVNSGVFGSQLHLVGALPAILPEFLAEFSQFRVHF